jgi:hypothetical protein
MLSKTSTSPLQDALRLSIILRLRCRARWRRERQHRQTARPFPVTSHITHHTSHTTQPVASHTHAHTHTHDVQYLVHTSHTAGKPVLAHEHALHFARSVRTRLRHNTIAYQLASAALCRGQHPDGIAEKLCTNSSVCGKRKPKVPSCEVPMVKGLRLVVQGLGAACVYACK